jgi:hypothetical protein
MTDDTRASAPQNERINVYISPEAKAMLDELGRALYPALKRSGGMIVDEAIRAKYAAFKQQQGKGRKS